MRHPYTCASWLTNEAAHLQQRIITAAICCSLRTAAHRTCMCLRLLWYIKGIGWIRSSLTSCESPKQSPHCTYLKPIQGALVCFYIMYILCCTVTLARPLCDVRLFFTPCLAGNHQQVPSKAARLYYAENRLTLRKTRAYNDDIQSRSSALSVAAVVQKDSAVLLSSYFQSSINQRRRRARRD